MDNPSWSLQQFGIPHLVGGLARLVPTAVGSDEGPATDANSVSGHDISGSVLGTTPGLSKCISARTTTSDRPARDGERRTIPVGLGGKTTSGRSISASGRSKMAPGADIEVGQLVGAGKPVESMYGARILRYH